MNDVMVTARMAPAKKEQGTKILSNLGLTASAAINELFDYLIENKSMPGQTNTGIGAPEDLHQRMRDAAAWCDSIPKSESAFTDAVSYKDITRMRLASKGQLEEADESCAAW